MDVSESHGEAYFPFFIRAQSRYTAVFSHIQNLKGNLRAFGGLSFPIPDRHRQLFRSGIGGCIIVEISHAFFPDAFLSHFPCEVGEVTAVHKQGPAGCMGKPSLVQDFLRLARSQEIPFSVQPYLYPCMIIITVGPSGSINLSGRYAGTAERGYRKGGLLPAPSLSAPVNGHGRSGSHIRRLISGIFRTPVIYGEHSLPEAIAAASRFRKQVLNLFIKKASVFTDILGIDPIIKNMVNKNILRQGRTPVLVLPEPKGMLHKA